MNIEKGEFIWATARYMFTSRTILFFEWARIKQPHYGTHAMNQNKVNASVFSVQRVISHKAIMLLGYAFPVRWQYASALVSSKEAIVYAEAQEPEKKWITGKWALILHMFIEHQQHCAAKSMRFRIFDHTLHRLYTFCKQFFHWRWLLII